VLLGIGAIILARICRTEPGETFLLLTNSPSNDRPDTLSSSQSSGEGIPNANIATDRRGDHGDQDKCLQACSARNRARWRLAGILVLTLGLALAISTGVSYTILSSRNAPLVTISAQGGIWTPSVWVIRASLVTANGAANLGVVYTFDFGNGEQRQSAVANVTYTYTVRNSVTLKITVRNNHGYTQSNSVHLPLDDGYGHPSIDSVWISSKIHFAPSNVSASGASSFTKHPNRTIAQYLWNFGGCGGSSSSWLPTNVPEMSNHVVTAPGPCVMKLRVVDNAGLFSRPQDDAQAMVVVPDGSPVPVLVLRYLDNKYGSAPLLVQFDASKSYAVYPLATIYKAVFLLPNGETYTCSLTPPSNATCLMPVRRITVYGQYSAAVTVYDTSGRQGKTIVNFYISKSNPIPKLKCFCDHGCVTNDVLTCTPDGTSVNYDGTTSCVCVVSCFNTCHILCDT